MKIFMRRTVAFMLMACLLLSVMAPVAMAAPVFNEETQTYPYHVYHPNGNINLRNSSTGASRGYVASLAGATVAEPYTNTGDLQVIEASTGDSTSNYIRFIATEETQDDGTIIAKDYRIQCNHFYVHDSYTSPQYIALKIEVLEKATYDISFDQSNLYADLYVEPYDSTKDYGNDFVKALTEYNGRISAKDTDTVTVEMDQGSYVFILVPYHAAPTSGNIHAQIYSISLAKQHVCSTETQATDTTPAFCSCGAVTGPALSSTVDEVGGQYTYSADYTDVTIPVSGDSGWINTAGYGMGDFDAYAWSGDYVLQNASSSSITAGPAQFKTDRWFALQFNVKKAGTFDLSVKYLCASDVNMYIIPTNALAFGEVTSDKTIDTVVEELPAAKTLPAYSIKNSTVADLGAVTFDTAGDYLIVFVSTADSSNIFRLYEMALKCYNVSDGTNNYSSVEKALLANEDAEAPVTLTLNGNITEDVTMLDGATLDLNGNIIYGETTIVNGQIVDNNSEKKGAVVGSLEATGNEWLPIETAEGTYSFYEATPKTGKAIYDEVNHSVSFWFDLDLADEGTYALIKNGGFELGATLTVGGTTYDIAGMEDAVNAWLDNKGVYDDGDDTTENNGALCVKVINLDKLTADTEIVVTPVFTNDYVSGMFGGAITYNYTVPAAE